MVIHIIKAIFVLRLLFDRLYYGFNNKKHGLRLDINHTIRVVDQYALQPWFISAHKGIGWRNIHALHWIEKNIEKNSTILDTGTGIGLNLFWLAERGFINLQGFDIDSNTISAGKNIVTNHYDDLIHLFVNDGLQPTCVKTIKNIDFIIAINWTYFLDNFDITQFLSTFCPILSPCGKVLIECIDTSFNSQKTDKLIDWFIGNRRLASDMIYKKIYNENDVKEAAEICNFNIVHIIDLTYKLVPRKIYILQKQI
jgi:2-polyprenyl-3-methyl-5-hydroxy-6-metoxy-1,4-benzoquinol methylase